MTRPDENSGTVTIELRAGPRAQCNFPLSLLQLRSRAMHFEPEGAHAPGCFLVCEVRYWDFESHVLIDRGSRATRPAPQLPAAGGGAMPRTIGERLWQWGCDGRSPHWGW